MSESETIEVSREELEELIDNRVEARVEAETAELRDEIESARDRIGELESELESRPQIEITDESDPVGSLEVGDAPLGKVITAKASESDVTWCEEEIEELKSDMEGGSTPTKGGVEADDPGVSVDDLTPMEQIASAGDPDDVTDSPSVQRAVSIFENLANWGNKTPKGYILSTSNDNALKLLEADRDENLSWKQFYRAARKVEQLTEGAVTFVSPSKKKGKRLILHDDTDVADRFRTAESSMTPSSVGKMV